MKEEIVVCKNLKKTFTVGNSKVHAVDGVSITFTNGEFISIVGPSGSGKTTLLNLIGTLEVPTNGKIIMKGIDLSDFTQIELTNFRRKNLGFVFQFFNLIEGLTGSENVELPLIFDSVPYETRQKRVDQIFKDFNLEYLQNNLISAIHNLYF